ncbi:DUF4190 domain-containing protein [Bifidobacterium sp. ESL0775]|uniref:DUF4190 domain-containing protein n=1 Tax=Bifidobacterium sp. ESL0775 TaxID=2983230 RepID=UPI0023F66BF0|nr:DUF4190 domain-containing protein [Bifidobacterium sp. ESL0775]WEV68949.1 DUF4190 domain-containing protein [Bifidobacterium sp. ESL0775]
MNSNDFGGDTPQGSGRGDSQYSGPQQNQNPSYGQAPQWQEPSYQQNAGYQAPYSYNAGYGAQNNPTPDYGAYGPMSMGPQNYYSPEPYQKWNTMCIIGFILSFFVPVVGLVLSIVALIQINHSGEKSKAMSIAGIVISVVSTILSIILAIALVAALGYGVSHYGDTDCHGSDYSSNPFNDDDDPDDDGEDTGYTYYRYDSPQDHIVTSSDLAISW